MRLFSVVLVISVVILLSNVFLGSIELSVFNWSALSADEKSILKEIIFFSRIPRSLGAFAGGSIMGLSGLIMQHLFRNVLAGPTTLGINAGASLGVAFYYFLAGSIALSSWFGAGLFAIIFALFFLALCLLSAFKFFKINSVLITGLLLGYVSFSLIEVLIHQSNNLSATAYMFWGMGTFNSLNWPLVALLFVIVFIIYLYGSLQRKNFDLYILGEEELKVNNVDPFKFRLIWFVLIGIAVGVVTAIMGPLAFIGIAIPNLVKMLRRSVAFRPLLAYCFVLGGTLTVFADVLSRGVLFDVVFPVNAMLCLLALPVIVLMFVRKSRTFS